MKTPVTRKAPEGDGQLELFVPAFAEVAFRDQQDLMENPFCTLSRKPRKEPIKYKVGDKYITITGNSETGIATIYDHDILIWAATQIREAADRGEQPSQTIVFHPYNLLKAIRRDTGGREYELLKDALRRLNGTNVETNIRLTDQEDPKRRSRKALVGFNLVNSWGAIEGEPKETDRWFIELPTWLFKGIVNHKLVLSIDPDYFLLTSGLERWLYRVFRKHAGQQELGWQFTMRQLHAKSGSSQRFSNFALDVRKIVARLNKEEDGNRGLPGYQVSISRNADGDEIVSGVARSQLAITDPGFQPKKNPRRRITHSGMNPPQYDNRPLAALSGKGKKPRRETPDEENPY